MVEHLDFEKLPGTNQIASHLDVRLRWRGFPGRMVVHDHNRSRSGDIDFRNNRQEWFEVYELSGIEKAFAQNGSFNGSLTDILPSSSIRVVAKTRVRWNGKPGEYRPYRFQTVVMFGVESQGRYANVRNITLSSI